MSPSPHDGGRIDLRFGQATDQRDRLGPILGEGAPQRGDPGGLVGAVGVVAALDERLAERDAQASLTPTLDPHPVGDRVAVAGHVGGARQAGVHPGRRGLELGGEPLEPLAPRTALGHGATDEPDQVLKETHGRIVACGLEASTSVGRGRGRGQGPRRRAEWAATWAHRTLSSSNPTTPPVTCAASGCKNPEHVETNANAEELDLMRDDHLQTSA